jgi:N-6 DNA Methylase
MSRQDPQSRGHDERRPEREALTHGNRSPLPRARENDRDCLGSQAARTAVGDPDRARAVAAAAARLAAATGRRLPGDLRLWALAGGRPEVDDAAEPAVAAGADLAAALEAATGPDQRRANGLHVTPRWLADQLVSRALEGLSDAPAVTVCDPACGGGAFLVAAARRLHRGGADRRRVVRHLLWGADIDPVGLAAAEAALALWAGEAPPPGRLLVADALADGGSVWADRPAGGFHLVVGNPPFQSQLGRATARTPDHQARLRARYGPAVRAYTDAAWLFLLAGCDLARPGGRVVLVEPQSLVGARDAGAVRSAIDERARLVDMWVDERPVFAAAVRVCAPVLEVGPERRNRVPNAWSARFADAVGIPRVRSHGAGAIGDLAHVIAGFRDEYYGLVDAVREHAAGDDDAAPLVTSGLIDWLGCSWGYRPARFAKRTWRAPVVDLAHLEHAGGPAARRWVARARGPKLLVATQTRVVEAAVDAKGSWVPSVPVVSVVPHDPADLWRVAAAVASPAATAWLLGRAPGTALARGALKVAAPELLALPLPPDRRAWDEAAAAVRTLTRGAKSQETCDRFLDAAATAYATPPALTAWWRERAGALASRPGPPDG